MEITFRDLQTKLRLNSSQILKITKKILHHENIDQVILLNQAGSNTHEDICESLELFAEEVMPEFHAREPQHQEWKRKVLAGKIELEEIDTDEFSFRGTAKPTIKPDGERIDSSTAAG